MEKRRAAKIKGVNKEKGRSEKKCIKMKEVKAVKLGRGGRGKEKNERRKVENNEERKE